MKLNICIKEKSSLQPRILVKSVIKPRIVPKIAPKAELNSSPEAPKTKLTPKLAIKQTPAVSIKPKPNVNRIVIDTTKSITIHYRWIMGRNYPFDGQNIYNDELDKIIGKLHDNGVHWLSVPEDIV